MLDADIGVYGIALGAVVDAEAVALVGVELDQAVDIVLAKPCLPAGIDLAEAAAAHRELHAWLARSGRRDEVERSAEHRGAEAVRHIAAIDFDRLRLLRIGEADDIGTVRAIERKAVLKHQNATLDRILLQTRAANLDARLVVAAEKALHDDAGNAGERVCNRWIRGEGVILLRHKGDAAGQSIEALLHTCRGWLRGFLLYPRRRRRA